MKRRDHRSASALLGASLALASPSVALADPPAPPPESSPASAPEAAPAPSGPPRPLVPRPYYPLPAAYPTYAAPDPYLLPPPLPRRRRSVGLYVGGVTAVAVGVGAVILGSYFAASAAGRIDVYCDMPSVPCAHKTDGERMTGGALTMAIGAVLGVAGVPMWILGSQYITLPPTDPSSPRATSSRLPEIQLGLGRATATLRF